MMNQGMSSISVGTINEVKKMMKIGRLPGKLYLAKTKPASESKKATLTVLITATMKEFLYQRGRSVLLMTSL